VFVRFADCVEGFVPRSELVVPDTAEGVREGQDMSVRIVAVVPERGRLGLTIDGVA
jgi:ribosomal protein S1